ncbi:MAG TPA: hypothetical protein VF601_12460 [Beijerinckiaceae bacterium]
MTVRAAILGGILLAWVSPALAAEWPGPVAEAVKEREAFCAGEGGRLADPAKAIRRLDLDGDGQDDFILDDGRLRCSKGLPGWCGSGGCSMEVFLSGAKGGLKSVLTELGSGYSVEKAGRGHRVTFRTRDGAVAYRFAEGCAILAGRRGERSC